MRLQRNNYKLLNSNHLKLATSKLFKLSLLSLSLGLASNHVSAEEQEQTAMEGEIEKIEIRHQRQPFRGDVPLNETPQAVSIIDGGFLLSAGVTDLQSALDFSSSIARQNNFGGMWDGFAIRGFAGDENIPSGYLVNGFNAGRGFSGRRNTANVQSIEILKGPGSALFGRSEPGGTVNIITKKPQFYRDGYVQLTLGNFGKQRVEGDFTNEISEDVAFRINGSYEDAESFRDTVESKHTTLNPSILWNISDETNLSYELEYLDQETPFDRGVVVLNGDFNTVPKERFLGDPIDGPINIDAVGHQLVLQHQLENDWSLLLGMGYRESTLEGVGSEPDLNGAVSDGTQIVAGRQLLSVDGETVVRRRRHRDFDATDLSLRAELSGNVGTGSLVHHLLIGIDAYDYQLDRTINEFRVGWGSGDTTFAVNLFNPVYASVAPELTKIATNDSEEQQSLGFYIQDQIDFTEKFKATLGVRVDKFEQELTNFKLDPSAGSYISKQDQTATSPRFGLVYVPSEFVTLYTSYAEGFRPNTGADADGNAFEPEKSKSYEVGVKWTSEDNVFDGTLAIFKAEKSNILSADPSGSGSSVALGEAQSQGIELDVTSNIGDNTSLALSYAYTDAETENAIINPDWGVELPAGSALINIAKNTANLTLRHFLTVGNSDADVGFTYQYVGDRLGETITPDYILPSYSITRVFGSVALTEKLTLNVSIDNLFDKDYFASSYHRYWTMPGAPRTYTASLKYQFD